MSRESGVPAAFQQIGTQLKAEMRAAELRLALPDDAEHRLELIELFLLLFRADERRRVRVPRVRGEKLSGGFGGLEKLGNNHRSSLSEQKESAAFPPIGNTVEGQVVNEQRVWRSCSVSADRQHS